jgi:DNA repair photolyase
MPIAVKEIEAKEPLSPSGLSDYCINPYRGCPHGCLYCYAQSMRGPYGAHPEPWGGFLDVKKFEKPIDLRKIEGKRVLLSSVTDAYNPYEAIYRSTRKIVERLSEARCSLTILTKGALARRDLDLFAKMRDLTFAMSLNTLDESFRSDMDKASPIAERLRALKEMHENGIRTALFIAPIFYGITDCLEIAEASHDFVDEYWLDGLNMKGPWKGKILSYIREKRPDLYPDYVRFYADGQTDDLRAYLDGIAHSFAEARLPYAAYFR